jgi:hypothetical protein
LITLEGVQLWQDVAPALLQPVSGAAQIVARYVTAAGNVTRSYP